MIEKGKTISTAAGKKEEQISAADEKLMDDELDSVAGGGDAAAYDIDPRLLHEKKEAEPLNNEVKTEVDIVGNW